MSEAHHIDIGTALRLPIATGNFATGSDGLQKGGFSFGIDLDRCAAALRELADGIDEKAALVQSVNHIVTAKRGDFTMHTVVIEFAAKP